MALMLLEGNNYVEDFLKHYHEDMFNKIKPILEKEEVKTYGAKLKDERLVFIQNLFSRALIDTTKNKYYKIDKTKQHKADHILLNK